MEGLTPEDDRVFMHSWITFVEGEVDSVVDKVNSLNEDVDALLARVRRFNAEHSPAPQSDED